LHASNPCYFQRSFFLSFQGKTADSLHSDIQRRDHPERGRDEILAARYSANDPGSGVSPGNNDGVSASDRSQMNERVTIDRAALH